VAEHAPTQEIRPGPRRPTGPLHVIESLPDKLRAMATRGHQVRAKDVATLVTAAQAIEAHMARWDHHMRVYGRLLGDYVEVQTQLLSLRELMQAGLDGKEEV